ncbi:MAG: nucleoside 2-deoxyribosyltransferase [archaeon]|jgi:nucleoside 2-deoxyribosyltransferase
MKLFLSIKFYEDSSNTDLIKNIIASAKISGNEMVSIFTDYENNGEKHFTPNELMKITFEAINSCDAMVIEFSEKGVGLGIEAGYAYSKNIPIFVIAKTNSDISDTLKGISKEIFIYNNLNELNDFFSRIRI